MSYFATDGKHVKIDWNHQRYKYYIALFTFEAKIVNCSII